MERKGSIKTGRALFDEILATYGEDNQKFLLISNVGKLLMSLADYERSSNYSNLTIKKDLISQSIADLEISLSQLKMIYNINSDVIKSYTESRLNKMDYELQQKLYNLNRLSTEFAVI